MTRTKLFRVVLIAVTLSGFAALAGCNTIQGLGRDMEAGGRAIRSTAEYTKDRI